MLLNATAATLVLLGVGVVVFVYHGRMNRMHPGGERERVTDWRFYAVIDWYLQISTVVFGVSAILTSHPLLFELHDNPWLLVAGMLVAGFGLMLFLAAMWALGRQYTPAHAAHLPTAIITRGPYRYIRHPVYAANLTMTAGVLLASGSLWLAVNLVVLRVYYHFAMRSEEASISSRFPQYQDYAARTGRLAPRVMDFFVETAARQAA